MGKCSHSQGFWQDSGDFLITCVTSLWKPNGRLDCVDLGKDFFLIHFSLQSDYGRVLKDGPWFVGGHYLSIKNWEANFRPSMTNVSSVATWVCLPQLLIGHRTSFEH